MLSPSAVFVRYFSDFFLLSFDANDDRHILHFIDVKKSWRWINCILTLIAYAQNDLSLKSFHKHIALTFFLYIYLISICTYKHQHFCSALISHYRLSIRKCIKWKKKSSDLSLLLRLLCIKLKANNNIYLT